MALIVCYKSLEKGTITNKQFGALDTWHLRNKELLRHEHYQLIARNANLSLDNVSIDIKPSKDNNFLVSYKVSGKDVYGQIVFGIGSACAANVFGEGKYYPEMAFKRAFDSYVERAAFVEIISH